MKLTPSSVSSHGARHRAGERAQARVVLVALICLVLGFGAGAWWIRTHGAAAGSETAASQTENQTGGLSAATLGILKQLNGPVEIRYYSLLDPKGASDSLRAFAGRVDQVLTEYQGASSGKIKLVRFNSQANDSAAANADGLTGFNTDLGDACFLGVTMRMGTNKVTISRLDPAWEAALEADLSRVIAALNIASQPAVTVASVSPETKAAAIAAVKTTIPDLAGTSLDDGIKLLRAKAIEAYAAAAQDMDSQMKDAQQKLSQAQASGSDADQQAAMKNLRDIQSAQGAKLRDIAQQSQAQIDAFKEMKQAGQ